jgi:hypothetical protein
MRTVAGGRWRVAGVLLAFPVWPQTPPAVYSAVYAGATVSCQRVYIAAADFRSSSPTSLLPILTVPAGWTPISIQLSEALPFGAGSPRVTALTVSLGTLQQPDWYVPALPLTGSARAEVLAGNPPTNARHTLYAALSCVNRDPDDLSSLSAGLLEVEVCGTVLPQIVPPPPPPPPPAPPPPPKPTGPLTIGTLDSAGVCQANWGLTFHPSYTSPPYKPDSHGNYPPRDPVTNQVIPAASMQGDKVVGNCVK